MCQGETIYLCCAHLSYKFCNEVSLGQECTNLQNLFWFTPLVSCANEDIQIGLLNVTQRYKRLDKAVTIAQLEM